MVNGSQYRNVNGQTNIMKANEWNEKYYNLKEPKTSDERMPQQPKVIKLLQKNIQQSNWKEEKG